MEFFLDILLDALKDTWTMLPLMYIAYVIIEYFQRKSDGSDAMFWNLQKWGPAFGALLGLLPQCGFSILAAMLFVQRNITLGTMIAVFIATSDEAIPVLISEPAFIPDLGLLLVLKLILAVCVGYFVDKVLFRHQKIILFKDMPEDEEDMEEEQDDEAAASCPCCYPQYPIWLSALLRTLKIYLFVFLCTLAFSLLIAWIGDEALSKLLLTGTWFQPILASLFGFIPNCAATVILCQLFAAGELSFASLFSGLVTNAGLGLVVLFQYSARKKWVWITMGILLVSALLGGYLIMIV